MSADVNRVPEPSSSKAMPRGSAVAVLLAVVLDVALVLVFAASGRSQHGEAASLAGLWETAWPFLFALAFTWAVALIWRRPFALLRSGLPVWIGTVVFGMLMRVAFTDGGAALPFVLVATGVLGVFLLGWRIIALLVMRLRRARA